MGWASARRSQAAIQSNEMKNKIAQQYDLGLQDLAEKRYDVALQRFEYILAQDPGFPGAADRLAEAMEIVYTTSTPTPRPSTATPTPTLDPRPVQELFQSALLLVRAQDWTAAIETLTALRKADRAYRAARVDGLLFLSLRSRGVQKIYKERNLQGGIYDLAVAERFGPIDAEASNARNLSRLYLYGVSFWEVDWAKSVEYFSQVASALPNLADSSGLSAAERYWTALIHYADQLASQAEWCQAQTQYETALALRAEPSTQEKLEAAKLMCLGPSETPTTTGETATPSTTTPGPLPSETPTQPPVGTPSATATQPTNTLMPTQPEATQAPTATQTAPSPYPTPATQESAGVFQGTASLAVVLLTNFCVLFSLLRHRIWN